MPERPESPGDVMTSSPRSSAPPEVFEQPAEQADDAVEDESAVADVAVDHDRIAEQVEPPPPADETPAAAEAEPAEPVPADVVEAADPLDGGDLVAAVDPADAEGSSDAEPASGDEPGARPADLAEAEPPAPVLSPEDEVAALAAQPVARANPRPGPTPSPTGAATSTVEEPEPATPAESAPPEAAAPPEPPAPPDPPTSPDSVVPQPDPTPRAAEPEAELDSSWFAPSAAEQTDVIPRYVAPDELASESSAQPWTTPESAWQPPPPAVTERAWQPPVPQPPTGTQPVEQQTDPVEPYEPYSEPVEQDTAVLEIPTPPTPQPIAQPPATPPTPVSPSGTPAQSYLPPEPDVPAGADAADAAAATVVLPRLVPDDEGAEHPTVRLDLAGPQDTPKAGETLSKPPDGPPTTASQPSPDRRRRLAVLVVAAVSGVLALLYVGDLLFGLHSTPRGVTVAGVAIGGQSRQEAEQTLRATIQPRTTAPIALEAAEVGTTVDPAAAGLQVDWSATLDRAAEQPLNPWTRLTSLFSDREVGVVSTADDTKLASVIEALAPSIDKAPVAGNVSFTGLTPAPVDPVPGRSLDQSSAAEVLTRDWAFGKPVSLPLIVLQPAAGVDAVRTALEQVARPAVAAPVTLVGEGKQATLTPEVIASALHFTPDGNGGLKPEVEAAKIVDAVTPALASTEQPGRDATLTVQAGATVITPSADGRGIDYATTLAALPDVLKRADGRQLTAIYAAQPAKVTADALKQLGITTVIGEFTTRGFAADSGQNIKRAAEQINGKIVKPGETFSLNGATGLRDAAQGYVEAGIIEDGHPARGIGGGVSQLATTTYNAAYFAGMTDVAHREHSFYISRYPVAREATVFEGSIDLKFRNDNPTGVLLQTVWTPSSITVRLFGTKRYEVTSATSARSNPTTPNEVVLPPGPTCHPGNGGAGFTATDTRTLREIGTGKVRQETHTVTYKPSPKILCGQPAAEPPG